MAISKLTMTDEQRKSVALEYLKAFDNEGETSSGGSILDLFADDAQVFFPKWGLADRQEADRPAVHRLRRPHQEHPARLRHVQLDHDRHRHVRGRGHERRRASRKARGAPASPTRAAGATCSRCATS